MYEIEKTERVKELIAVTKSDSGVSGPQLCAAHMELGRILAEGFRGLDPDDTTVVAMLRGGIFFAAGIYFALGCRFETFDPKRQAFDRPATKNVILVDSVINTGNTIKDILGPDMYVACAVINEEAVPLFDRQLYTVRVSSNRFTGAPVRSQKGNRGPDTTMRLFNQL